MVLNACPKEFDPCYRRDETPTSTEVGIWPLQVLQWFWQEAKTHAMVFGGAVLANGGPMRCRGIAFVLVPMVHRIFFMDLVHIGIAVGFGQNRGGRNAHELAVALDDAFIRDFAKGLKAIAVYDDIFRDRDQLVQGLVHRQDGGIEDVDLIDFCGIDMGHPKADRFFFQNGS